MNLLKAFDLSTDLRPLLANLGESSAALEREKWALTIMRRWGTNPVAVEIADALHDNTPEETVVAVNG